MNKRRIWIWGINYSPELTGIGPYNTALAEFLTKRGHEVHLLTTFAYYPAWQKIPTERTIFFRSDDIEGVRVHRCWHYVPKRPTLLRRLFHEATFLFTSMVRAFFLSKPDLMIVISPPLGLGIAGSFFSWWHRAPMVFHVQDLQPDAAMGLGYMRSSAFLRLLLWVERKAYQRAWKVSGIMPGMLRAFEEKGVGSDRMLFFPNGVEIPAALPPSGRFRKRVGIPEDRFLIVYSGNLGQKQGLDLVLEGMARVKNSQVQLVLCGDGHQRGRLQSLAAECGLKSVLFLPLQAELHYREMLVDAQLCLVPQMAGTGRCFFPSKLLQCLALGRPILTVSDPESDLAQAVQEGGFGKNVEPGDSRVWAETVEGLVGQTDQLEIWGRAGRVYVERFSMSRVLNGFADAIGC